MIPHTFIRHIVTISRPTVSEKRGTERVMVDEPYTAFEPGFYCGFVHGECRKYHHSAVVKKIRVTREVDRDGHPVDEREEIIWPVSTVEAEKEVPVP